MVKKGVLVLILLLIFSSAALENSYARNTPRLVDEQDNMHPWGGDDSNTGGTFSADDYNPISPADYPLQVNYGSKANLISGLFRVAWDEMKYFFFGIRATSQPPRDRISDGSPTSSGFSQPDSGPTGGRSGL